jgi:hypothetical protein
MKKKQAITLMTQTPYLTNLRIKKRRRKEAVVVVATVAAAVILMIHLLMRDVKTMKKSCINRSLQLRQREQ